MPARLAMTMKVEREQPVSQAVAWERMLDGLALVS
jgi:hypothetical protein